MNQTNKINARAEIKPQTEPSSPDMPYRPTGSTKSPMVQAHPAAFGGSRITNPVRQTSPAAPYSLSSVSRSNRSGG